MERLLDIPQNRAPSPHRDAVVLGVLSHTPPSPQEGHEQAVIGLLCQACGKQCSANTYFSFAMLRFVSQWDLLKIGKKIKCFPFFCVYMCVVCMLVWKCVGEHVCVGMCARMCIYMWRTEIDIGNLQYLHAVYTCFFPLEPRACQFSWSG